MVKYGVVFTTYHHLLPRVLSGDKTPNSVAVNANAQL